MNESTLLTKKMAPTGRGSLRPYQPSKFQPFIIVCLFVTVIVVGFNFWNLMKKNSLLLFEIGKVQSDFKREESEKKNCHVLYKSAEGKLKSHEDIDHEKEILLEDTRRIVEDLKAEAENLRQNITRLLSRIADTELFNSRKENKSQRECESRMEALRLQSQSSCDAEIERLQHEASDQMDTMKKQLKLQFQETQQLDQMLQQQKQHPAEDAKKQQQQINNLTPIENNNIERHGDTQDQQQQQQQRQQKQQQQHEGHHQQQQEGEQQKQHEGQQWQQSEGQHQQQQEGQHQHQHEGLQLQQQEGQQQQHHEGQQQQREKLREIQQQDQINVPADQKPSSGQQIQRRGQQSNLVGDRKRRRKVPTNMGYNQTGGQRLGLHSKMDRAQVRDEKPDLQDQTRAKDTYRVRQGEPQQNAERKERIEKEEVQRVQDAEPPGSQPEMSDNDQQDGSVQVPSNGEKNQIEPPQKQRQLFKQSDQNATVLAIPRQRELAAAADSMSQATDQREEVPPTSNDDAADDNQAEHLQKQDDAGEVNHVDVNSEGVDQSASVKPDETLIQDGSEKSKNSISLDVEKPAEGNADI